MPIENRNLIPGTRLVARYHKQAYSCQVIVGECGKPRYQLEGGIEVKSLSAAGTAITGKSCNGWSFWSLAQEETTSTPTPESTEDSPKETQSEIEVAETIPEDAEQPDVTKKGLFRTPNQKGVPENQIRWFCSECKSSFLSSTDEMPDTCPQGHTG